MIRYVPSLGPTNPHRTGFILGLSDLAPFLKVLEWMKLAEQGQTLKSSEQLIRTQTACGFGENATSAACRATDEVVR